ncbi:hypothetical protein [Phenylobacterium sp. J367]|uniref:hypothetical protein n=1 Tax=Phenylobacterium sp. J367 TaxID=2898435 RepID=UPI002151FC0C|nr:hypothetical protein [Phenylobacterium sp. J367]MCR5881172.1 hypothetical protein [Phenylobacterium sp. J367]
MGRIVAIVLAGVLGANGLAMLFAGQWWYGAVPSVPLTGPYNPHFVRDIGVAYLITAGGLAWFARAPRQGWPALVLAAGFLTLHAAIHVYDAACGTAPLVAAARDFAAVYAPALIALGLALVPPKETA